MIKFFRKIRQNLLTENKFSKYLLYAIGEIILVVIGIFLAIQLNNLNENRKDSKQERIVLMSLLDNLHLAKKQSELLISEEEALKKRLIRILGIEHNPNVNINQIIPDSIFKTTVWDLQNDQPTFNVYSNLKNTNKLSLIKNKNVNEKFTNLEFRMNRLNDILEDRLSVHQIRIDDILERDINFIPLIKSNVPEINIINETENDYYELLKIKRIRNLLGMKLTLTQDVIDRREYLDKEIGELIVMIKNEIKE